MSAAPRSDMKVVAAGGRCGGRCCRQVWDCWRWRSWRTFSGAWVRAVIAALGLILGLGLAAGWVSVAAMGLGGCFAVVLGFCRAAGAGFTELCRRPG